MLVALCSLKVTRSWPCVTSGVRERGVTLQFPRCKSTMYSVPVTSQSTQGQYQAYCPHLPQTTAPWTIAPPPPSTIPPPPQYGRTIARPQRSKPDGHTHNYIILTGVHDTPARTVFHSQRKHASLHCNTNKSIHPSCPIWMLLLWTL